MIVPVNETTVVYVQVLLWKLAVPVNFQGVEELQFLWYLFSMAKGYQYEEGNIILPPSHSKAGL